MGSRTPRREEDESPASPLFPLVSAQKMRMLERENESLLGKRSRKIGIIPFPPPNFGMIFATSPPVAPFPAPPWRLIRRAFAILLFALPVCASASQAPFLFAAVDYPEASSLSNSLDRFWVLVAAFLVFFMQAGFKAMESGLVRKPHADSVAVKNLLDWLIVCVVFYAVGFGLMFGATNEGWIGESLFFPEADALARIAGESSHGLGFEFFLFQLAFAGTAATIVSGAIAERTILSTYLLLAGLTTLLYSVLGHWSWGGLYLENQQGFLERRGFHDFAGSTVVHSLGAWVALAAVIVIRPRAGRYAADGSIQFGRFMPNSLHYSAMGVIILWLGWFGFNGGSVLAFNDQVAPIIFKTTICGATAGLTAFFFGWMTSAVKINVYPKLMGGIVGGLVAATACCDVISQNQAIILGIFSGFIHNLAFDLMLRLRWDDVVGAVPIHGACGVIGTLWVAVAEPSFEKMMDTLQVQAFGVTVVFVASFFPALLLCLFFHGTMGLRIGLQQERDGYVIGSRRDGSSVS
ncbi:MAG: hypothetical protein AAF191_08295 [Verrucomicrobiota bacterium]